MFGHFVFWTLSSVPDQVRGFRQNAFSKSGRQTSPHHRMNIVLIETPPNTVMYSRRYSDRTDPRSVETSPRTGYRTCLLVTPSGEQDVRPTPMFEVPAHTHFTQAPGASHTVRWVPCTAKVTGGYSSRPAQSRIHVLFHHRLSSCILFFALSLFAAKTAHYFTSCFTSAAICASAILLPPD